MAQSPSGSPSRDAKFRGIFDAHLPMVQRYCVRRLQTADANEAISEVFLVVWRRIDEIPGGDETLPWVLVVARNVVRNLQRTSRRSIRLLEKIGREPVVPDPGPEAQVVRATEYEAVAAALETLSTADQEVIRLRAWEELSAAQIAAVLGCSLPAAEKRVARASTRLSRAVERQQSVRSRAIRKRGMHD